MRSVLTSGVEQILAIGGGVTVYRLTNGQSWAQAGSDPGSVVRGAPRVALYHAGSRFYLGAEGSDALVEVSLVACRRKVWNDVIFARVQGGAAEPVGDDRRDGAGATAEAVAEARRGGIDPSAFKACLVAMA